MNHRLVRIIMGVEYGLGTIILGVALYLITAPLHPPGGDVHAGMQAVFPGLILLSFSIAVFFAAHALKRGGRKHWIQQFGVIALCVGLLAVLALR